MKVYLAADHAGFNLKNALVEHVRTLGHDAEDLGALALDPADDYPDFAKTLAERVLADPGSRGFLICGTGQGEAMAANRLSGIRAAVFYGEMRVREALELEGGTSQDGFDVVRLARRHNDANILAIGARFVLASEADEAVRIFLDTPFSTDARHARRISKF